MLVFVEVEIAFGLLVFFAEHAVSRGELGHDQAASAEVANEAAEDGIGDSGHGGQDRGGGDGDGADREAVRHALQPCWIANTCVRSIRVRWRCRADRACPERAEGSVHPTRTFRSVQNFFTVLFY